MTNMDGIKKRTPEVVNNPKELDNKTESALGHFSAGTSILAKKTAEFSSNATQKVVSGAAWTAEGISDAIKYGVDTTKNGLISAKETTAELLDKTRNAITRRRVGGVVLTILAAGAVYAGYKWLNSGNHFTHTNNDKQNEAPKTPTPDEICQEKTGDKSSFIIPGLEHGDRGYWNKDGFRLPEVGASDEETKAAYYKWFDEIADQDPINLLGNTTEINRAYLDYYTRKNINGKFDHEIENEKRIKALVDYINTQRQQAEKNGNFDPYVALSDSGNGSHCASPNAVTLRNYALSKQIQAEIIIVTSGEARDYNNSFVSGNKVIFTEPGDNTAGQKAMRVLFQDSYNNPITTEVDGAETPYTYDIQEICAQPSTKKKNHEKDSSKEETHLNSKTTTQISAGSDHTRNSGNGRKPTVTVVTPVENTPKTVATDTAKEGGETNTTATGATVEVKPEKKSEETPSATINTGTVTSL